MATYLHLAPWADALEVLRQLRAQGLRLAFLSNFTATMLDANIRSGGLGTLSEARLTTDRVSAYKPDPRSYQMAVDHFGLPRAAIAFVAFAGWDAAGAKRFGFPVYWSNRLALPPEELDAPSDRVAAGLAALPQFLADR
jgi:2-haloacid dehalogenase